MEKKMKWGLATLLLLLGIAAVFIFLDQNAELQQLEKETAESDKLRQEHNKPQETPVAVEELPPVVPPNEHPSGPHQHEDDTAHNHSPIVSQTSNGPLTFHAELLKTNPVKALRLQAEERGHWSAKWIPPFPPDDLEAAEIARTKYLIIYYKTIGDLDNPECKKAIRADSEQISRTMKTMTEAKTMGKSYDRARVSDLLMLSWPRFPESDVPPLYEKGWRAAPSNYYPMRIEDLK